MSLVSSSIPNFVNGVSQQPFTLRLSSQGELQENGLSTVSGGLRKRPPTEHVAKISGTPLSDAYTHLINRDDTEQYKVLITPGDLKVYDLAGNPQTVAFTNKPYLSTALPALESFALTTVADYTFVVNKAVATAASSTLGATRPFESLLNVKSGNYGKTYTVSINGTVQASFLTPDGTTPGTGTPPSVQQVATDYIALQLLNGLVASGFNTAPWSVVQFGSVLYLKNTTTDFTLTCEDGFNNNALVAIKRKLQKFQDLPNNPRVDGFMVEIIGDQSSEFDNYWVKFDAGGSNGNVGVWREAVAPGLSIGLDPLKMPHQLIRQADGTFTFGPATWTARLTGDLKSNDNPSFVGRTINDVFFYENRLGLLSDENYIMSETGKYFNMFRTTVTTLLDSDPVDVNVATNKVAVLQHAVGFNKQLLLFSGQQQFVTDNTQLMTPKKVPIKPTTDFWVNTKCKPVAAGRNIYFSTDKGKWSAIREYFTDLNNAANDATDVSSHIPNYIPSGVTKIAAGSTEDVLAMLTGDRSKVFVYKFFFSGNEKLQSSWSTFSFSAGGTVLSCDFIKSTLYMVVSRSDGVYFEKMDFAVGSAGDGEPYQVLLDRKLQIPKASLSFDGVYTKISPGALPYSPAAGSYMAVAKGGGGIKPGQLLSFAYDGADCKVRGDYTATDISFGQKFMFRYGLSTLTIKVPSPGGGMKSDTEGRVQVRRISFNHAATGYYQVKVTPEARQTYTYTFAGKTLGTPSANIGAIGLSTDRFSVPVMSKNIRTDIIIESDMPLPVSILSADWEAFYVKRSTPV